MGFVGELRRRNVIRMAGLYLVGAWLIVQVAGTLLPVFEAPAWVMKAVVGTLALGFVPALVFSWVFELTPEGLKRDADVPLEASIAPQTARRMDRAIIAVLALALVYFGFDKLVLGPRRDAALVAATTRAAKAEAAARPAAASRSIAVLPFVNMSGDPANEFFSDGITEEILNALAQIPDLNVAARTSSFAFKAGRTDLRKVGETLGVAHVLEGSVQRAGDDVRITAQLIDAQSGFHLWSEKFDRKAANIFAVEDEISRAIATRLQVRLSGVEGRASGHTEDARAHELYLRGLTLMAARGTGLRDAVAAFAQAVAIDPGYAQGWGALAQAEQLLPGYVDTDRVSATARSEVAAQRALALDANTASALVAMAVVHGYRLEWAEADAAFRRALALAPSDAEAANQYAQFTYTTGQLDLALERIDRARQLDPLSAIIGVVRGDILRSLRRNPEATAQFEAVLAAHPDFYPACMTAMLHDLELRRYPEAESLMRNIAGQLGVDPAAKGAIVRGIADPAGRTAAIASLDASPANADLRRDLIVHAALLSLLGASDRALERLEAYAARPDAANPGTLWAASFDSLRGDPRFKAVLARLGVPYRPSAQAAP